MEKSRKIDFLTLYLQPHLTSILLLALLLFGVTGFQLATAQVLRIFIDAVTESKGDNTLIGIAILFLSIVVLNQVTTISSMYVGENIAWRATNALRADLASYCLNLDMSFHHEHTPGELIERIDGDVTVLSDFFSSFTIRILGNVLLLFGILLLLFRENIWIGIGLTVFASIALTVLYCMRDIAVTHIRASQQAKALFIGLIEEILTGTEDIRANGGKSYVFHRFYLLIRQLMKADRKANVMRSLVVNIGLISLAFGNVLGLGLGAYFFLKDSITIGTVFLIYYYTDLLRTPLQQISNDVRLLQGASASIDRIQELYRISSIDPNKTGETLPAEALPVEFDNVSFAYTPEKTVLSQLSFRLEPGKVLGILGRTGSGKTSIVQLLARLHEPSKGMIYLGGIPLGKVQLSSLRYSVGIVTQDVQLLQATVRDNITLFSPTISDEQVLDALNKLNLWRWYKQLPDGLDTEINTSQRQLSGGEAQLLAFARVLLCDPGLVILDEASSRLDPASESLVTLATKRLLEGRTGIIIAHRLETIKHVDKVMILKSGRIHEYENYEKLAEDPNSYLSQLLQTKFEDLAE